MVSDIKSNSIASQNPAAKTSLSRPLVALNLWRTWLPQKEGMEDLLAASPMSHSHRHSAPLYLLYNVSNLTSHGLAPPVHDDDDDDDGFEFATVAAKDGGDAAALRACASDVSADDLFRAGVLLPLRLPPRLQRPARSAGASAATSPTASATCRTKQHWGFDPFAAALEKVRKDAGGAAPPKRWRSLSPLRGSAAVTVALPAAHKKKDGSNSRSTAARPAWLQARKGVKHLLYRAVVASAAAAPRALRQRRKDGGMSYRPGLLVCFGF